jgi:hypothetical protein
MGLNIYSVNSDHHTSSLLVSFNLACVANGVTLLTQASSTTEFCKGLVIEEALHVHAKSLQRKKLCEFIKKKGSDLDQYIRRMNTSSRISPKRNFPQ